MNGPHYFVAGQCWSCGQLISFDPNRVPSMPLGRSGRPVTAAHQIERRAPLCLDCVKAANVERKAQGLATWNEDPSIWETVAGYPE